MNGVSERARCRVGGIIAAVAVLLVSQGSYAAAAGRPIISNNTVKTAEGELLRGCHAHIARAADNHIVTFFTNLDNVITLRDEMHMNVIRVCCLTPGWGGYSTAEESYSYADAIVNNCETAGIYAIINYHGPISESGAWNIHAFWDRMVSLYKDKPFVILNLINEQFQAPGGATYLETLYRRVRESAPNSMIFAYEPVGVVIDWVPWLRTGYPNTYGFSWDQGKDAWSFHTYIGTKALHILEVKNAGIPLINSECSFKEEGYPDASLEGTHFSGEFFEKHGISWMVWQQWQRGREQFEAIREHLIPDATAKGYAWWTKSAPSVPQNLAASVLSAYDVELTWSAPASVGDGIMSYIVFRDGKEVGWPTEASFADTGLSPSSTYSYEVMALAEGSMAGPKTAAVGVVTPSDNEPPRAALVSGTGNGSTVRIVFTEKVDRTTAQSTANYTIDNGVTISGATLGADLKTVTLITSALELGSAYTLSISNIKDLASTPNVISSNTSHPFNYAAGVTRIRFFPRATFAARMVNGVFEATNGSPDAGPYVILYRIRSQPADNTWTEVTEAQWTAQTGAANFDRGYRYIRYRGYAGHCNVSEIEFYSGDTKLTGTAFGAPESYSGASGDDFTTAFDGSTATFFDYAEDLGGYTGQDMGDRVAAALHRHTGAHPAGFGIAVRNSTVLCISGLAPSTAIRVTIYDTRGSVLNTHEQVTAGEAGSQETFVLCDRTGRPLASGHYLLKVKAGEFEAARPMTLAR